MLKTALQIALIQVLAFGLPIIVGFAHKGVEVSVYAFERDNTIYVACVAKCKRNPVIL